MKTTTFLLTGFKHDHSMRVYTFDRVEADRTRTSFTVSADLSLISKYNIRVQDLPLLCRSVLDVIDGTEPPLHSLLSEEDMIGFCTRKADAQRAAGEKRKFHRKPPGNRTGLAWRT